MPPDAPPVSRLEDHLGYWLRYVSNQVSHAFAQKLAARGVTVAEWVAMRELFDAAGMVPSVLAERLGMTRGAVSKLVDRLQAKGMVERAASDADRRSHMLSLTATGRRLMPTLAALADANDAEFFGHLGRTERAAIVAAMKDIVRRKDLRAVPMT
jgi:DNA-binding MarR family transcriptional regulator